MIWLNLKQNTCPHCSADIVEDHLLGEFKCVVCKFHITAAKKLAIETHRANPDSAIIRMRWQNLREEKCPMCASSLDYGVGPYEILACIAPDCTFKIRHDTFLEILGDENHPANTFYEREKLIKHELEELQ